MRQITALAEPTRNTGILIGPTPLGIKKPITTDAIRIFDTSERYWERISICALVSRIIQKIIYFSGAETPE